MGQLYRGFNKSRLLAVYRHLYDLLLPSVSISLMKIKTILTKKANSTTTLTTTTEIFKCYKNSMLFDAQNTGNHISELLHVDFKFFWGTCPQRGKASCGPFSSHSHLLHQRWLLITQVVETPAVKPRSPHPQQICYFVGEFYPQQAVSPLVSRANQAYSTVRVADAMGYGP